MPHALQFLILTFAGWLNRHQEDLIDYLREEARKRGEIESSASRAPQNDLRGEGRNAR